MVKFKAQYWDDRTLFSKEKLNEYDQILAEIIQKWDPKKFDATAYKLMSYFVEMKKVHDTLRDEFGEEKSITEMVTLDKINSFKPVSEEMRENYVCSTDRWGVALIIDDNSDMKTIKMKDMILS